MSSAWTDLGAGFLVALEPTNLLFCFVGVLLGTLVGVLPGLGPLATLAMLLPVTFQLQPTTALIMLAGIYYGAQYGGSTTAILIKIPGESSSVVTVLDGHAMARNGRAGAALSIAAVGSLFAGCVSIVLMALASGPLTALALKFGAPEYFALMVLGLVGAIILASGSMLKAVGMTVLGILLGTVGTDLNSGTERFTFHLPQIAEGISFITIAMGLFGIAEIIANLEQSSRRPAGAVVGSLWPTREEMRRAVPAVVRGTAVGSVLGILPGGGALLSSFAAYALEKRIAKNPSEFGNGAVEGLAAPESANNAGAQTSFIPLLTLGIPSNAVMAVMLGAMMIHGIAPGPKVMTDYSSLFWGLIASMFIGNIMLVILNLPLIGIWTKVLHVPYRLMFPFILVVCFIGVYSVNNSVVDIAIAGLFGFLGYAFIKFGCEPAPLLLGFILGPMMEENLRRSLLLSQGDPTVFLARPISLTLLILAIALAAVVIIPSVRASDPPSVKSAN